MNAHNGRVDHLDGCIMSSSQCVHDPAPNASPTPPNEAIVASGIGAELMRQVAPRCPRSQDPADAIQDAAVVHSGDTAWLVWQPRFDGSPLVIGKLIAHDWKLQFGGLNHGLAAGLNVASLKELSVAFRPKAEVLGSV